MLDIGVVMDPLASINLKKDTTLAMIRAAQLRGHRLWYLRQEDLFLHQGVATGAMRELRLTEPFVTALDPYTVPAGGSWHAVGEEQRRPLRELDVILMRKDPPFDMEYIYTTYLLERAEADGVLVANRPASLRDCNEKVFATSFPQCCPPLLISRRADLIKDFAAEHGDIVLKPLDGMGGMSVFRIVRGDPNLNVVIETLTNRGAQQIMAQKFVPEIVDGDKRILIVDGVPVPYCLARVPMAGEARGNLAAGGTGVARPLTEHDWEIARALGPTLKQAGLLLVGLDVIGDSLTEVNVTSPTCFQEITQQTGFDVAAMFVDALEKAVKGE
jgi:glutathione synthase